MGLRLVFWTGGTGFCRSHKISCLSSSAIVALVSILGKPGNEDRGSRIVNGERERDVGQFLKKNLFFMVFGSLSLIIMFICKMTKVVLGEVGKRY